MIDLRHPLAVPSIHMPWQEIEASLAGAITPEQLKKVVDSTVMLKVIAYPTDSNLYGQAEKNLWKKPRQTPLR